MQRVEAANALARKSCIRKNLLHLVPLGLQRRPVIGKATGPERQQ
jgi:hypothetical protein